MKEKEMIEAVKQAGTLAGMTVNERLFASGLIVEFDRAKKSDKTKARRILELLQVDNSSINKILL